VSTNPHRRERDRLKREREEYEGINLWHHHQHQQKKNTNHYCNLCDKLSTGVDGTGIMDDCRSSRPIRRTNQIVAGGVKANVSLADGGPVDVPEDPVGDLIATQQVLDEERDDDEEEDDDDETMSRRRKKTVMTLMKRKTKTTTMNWLF